MSNDYWKTLGFSSEEEHEQYMANIRRQIEEEDYLENQTYNPNDDADLQAIVSQLNDSYRTQYERIEAQKIQNRNDVDSIKRSLHHTANAMLKSQQYRNTKK